MVDSVTTKSSVEKIFCSMESEYEAENFNLAWTWIKRNLVWINDNLDGYKITVDDKKEELSFDEIKILDSSEDFFHHTKITTDNESLHCPDAVFGRIQILERLSKLIESNASLFGQLLCLRSKDTLHHIMKNDVHYFVQYFKNLSSLPLVVYDDKGYIFEKDILLQKREEMPRKINNLYELCWKCGHDFVHQFRKEVALTESFSLPFMLFMKLCTEAGIQKTEFKILGVEKSDVPNQFDVSSGGEGAMIICDKVDVDAAVECIIENTQYHWRQSPWAIKRVLVQESIFNKFYGRLLDRIEKCFFNRSAQLSCLKNEECVQTKKLIEEAEAEGIKANELAIIGDGRYVGPVIFRGRPQVCAGNESIQKLLYVTTEKFRTAAEVISLLNSSSSVLCTAASVWTECQPTADKISSILKVQTVWLNVHGLLNPAVPFAVPQLGSMAIKQNVFCVQLQHLNCSVPHIGSNSVITPVTDRYDSLVAKAVKVQAEWHKAGLLKRSNILTAIALKLFEQKDYYDRLFEHGPEDTQKNKSSARCAARAFLHYAEECQYSTLSSLLGTADAAVKISCEPIGLVLMDQFGSLNLYDFACYTAPLLGYGNAIIWDVGSKGIQLGNEFSQLLKSCGLPDGLFNFIASQDESFTHGEIKVKFSRKGVDTAPIVELKNVFYTSLSYKTFIHKAVWTPF